MPRVDLKPQTCQTAAHWYKSLLEGDEFPLRQSRLERAISFRQPCVFQQSLGDQDP